jgi:hypothetical protein
MLKVDLRGLKVQVTAHGQSLRDAVAGFWPTA